MSHYQFSVEPDIFVDYSSDAAVVVPSTYPSPGQTSLVPTQPNFGLIERPYPGDDDDDVDAAPGGRKRSWERLQVYVGRLNAEAPEGTSYKVVFALRHGFGIHNVWEAKYGHDEWNDHMARQEGNGTVVWADAYLVEQGIKQAEDLGRLWSAAADQAGLALPTAILSSPLRRCVHTSRLAFAPLMAAAADRRPYRPLIKENLREKLCDHTCDRRSPRTVIAAEFPEANFEAGFVDEDQLWQPYFDSRAVEEPTHHEARNKLVLEDVWNGVGAPDPDAGFGDCIVLTMHSEAIKALLRLLKQNIFNPSQGSAFTFLIKAEKLT